MGFTNIFEHSSVTQLIQSALNEDIGTGDITTFCTISPDDYQSAIILAKQDGIIAGLPLIPIIFHHLDSSTRVDWLPTAQDGDFISKGTICGRCYTRTNLLLPAERTILNFLQRLSGIATTTQLYVQAVNGTTTKICDTRKTLPGWRLLDKYAVTMGGGTNHRVGLYDMVMIKDNHRDAAGSLTKAIRAVHVTVQNQPHIPVEVETRTLDDVHEVMQCFGAGLRVNRIMFDNFTPSDVANALEIIQGRLTTEVSGGITLQNIHSYAQTGVDYISVGALTHSAPAMDISMKIQPSI